MSGSSKLPLVTVITPTYNSNKQYLYEAIDSVLMQTYPKIEYIITDDGSVEFQKEEIRSYILEKKRDNIELIIIRNPVNVGTVKNLNGAIRALHGEYIFVLAHDDVYYDKDVIYNLVMIFINSQVLVISPCRAEYDETLSSCISVFPSSQDLEIVRTANPKDLYKLYCQHKFTIAMIVLSRKCIEKYLLFDERYVVLEDWSTINTLLRSAEKMYFTNLIYSKHRIGGISTSGKVNLKLFKDDTLVFKERAKYCGFGLGLKYYINGYFVYIQRELYYRYLLIESEICNNDISKCNSLSIIKQEYYLLKLLLKVMDILHSSVLRIKTSLKMS